MGFLHGDFNSSQIHEFQVFSIGICTCLLVDIYRFFQYFIISMLKSRYIEKRLSKKVLERIIYTNTTPNVQPDNRYRNYIGGFNIRTGLYHPTSYIYISNSREGSRSH